MVLYFLNNETRRGKKFKHLIFIDIDLPHSRNI